MDLLKKLAYMGVGALLVLLVGFGVAGTFAQEDGRARPSTVDGAEIETAFPGRVAHPDFERPEPGTYLAEALGISTEELADAREEVRLAGIDAALEQELITEAQAQWLRERTGRLPRRAPFPIEMFEFDAEAALADALGITVEELEAARDEAFELALDARVEAGLLAEEEAELISARRAVNEYVDRDALVEVMQQMYEDAVQQALDAGAITEAEAELLLENAPTFERFEQGGRHPHGPGRQGGPAGFAPEAPQSPAGLGA